MARAFVMGRLKSIRCAAAGVGHLIRSQQNARVHLAASAAVIGVGVAMRLSAGEWCWMLVAMGAVWVAEALNTAVELVADAVHPARHPLIGRAKDVAAGGVLLAAGMAVAIGIAVIAPHLFAR